MEKNNAQEEIIHTVNGQLLVVACPGSGKTTTLLRRIHYMINEAKIPAQQILMVTFSSAAAKEMKTRYQKKFGMDAVTFSTIHSMCMSILKKFGGYTKESILSDPREYFYEVLRKQKGINDINEFITGLITEISVINNNSIDLNSYKPKCTKDKKLFLKLINGYQEYKEEFHLIDFDDMLQKAYEIMVNDKECLDFLRNKYRYIQVDEYQDTNLIQKDIIYLLAGQDGNLAVVGDDDQSIYAFRGAKPEIMLNFQKEYPKSKMVKMSTNYRSGKKIISEADRVIKSNTNRFQKDFIGFKPENGAVEYIVTEEKKDEILKIYSRIKKLLNDGENPADIAVLFRTNRQAEKMAAILFRNQIPFQSNEKIQSKRRAGKDGKGEQRNSFKQTSSAYINLSDEDFLDRMESIHIYIEEYTHIVAQNSLAANLKKLDDIYKRGEYDPNLPSEAHSSTQQQTTPADPNVPQQAATTNSQPTQSNPVLPDMPELHTMELKITSNFQAMENSYVVKCEIGGRVYLLYCNNPIPKELIEAQKSGATITARLYSKDKTMWYYDLAS